MFLVLYLLYLLDCELLLFDTMLEWYLSFNGSLTCQTDFLGEVLLLGCLGTNH